MDISHKGDTKIIFYSGQRGNLTLYAPFVVNNYLQVAYPIILSSVV